MKIHRNATPEQVRQFIDGLKKDLELAQGKYEITIAFAQEWDPFGDNDHIVTGTTRILCIGKPSVELKS